MIWSMIQAADMAGSGWFKLYRELFDKAIWKGSTPEQKVILITILGMVFHDENEWDWKGNKFETKPGQRITSLEKIAELAGKGISIQNIRTALKKFENYGFLTNESTKTGRLITVVNWELYQSKDDDLTRLLTVDQQRANKELTPTKNDKNNKKDIIVESDLDLIVEKFNSTCVSLPGIKKLTDKRKGILRKWVKDDGTDTIYEVFEKVEESDFLSGKIENPERPWKASFDWIINPTNRLKILEGNYTNKDKKDLATKKLELKPFDPSQWE